MGAIMSFHVQLPEALCLNLKRTAIVSHRRPETQKIQQTDDDGQGSGIQLAQDMP